MAIPSWAVDVLRRGMGGMVEKMPPDTLDQLRKKASDLWAELPQTAAKRVDSVMRSARVGKESLQRWSRRHVALVTPVVNASGCLTDSRIAGVPLGQEAIEVALEAFQSGALTLPAAQDRLNHRLGKCLGSSQWGILIASNMEGACYAVAKANAAVPIYFHRSQSQRLSSGLPIPDAFGAGAADATGRVHEVGSVDRVDADEVQTLSGKVMVVGVENGTGDGAWFQPTKEGQAQPEMTRVMLLPVAQLAAATPGASPMNATPPLPTVIDLLGQSADLVITPGDAAMGGPRCGLIIGDKKRLQNIASSPLWKAASADVSVRAAMTTTLESLVEGDIEAVPVLAMLSTSEENLRSRAERLATRIAAEPIVRSCQITARPAKLSARGAFTIASRQLKLTHRDLSANDWAAKLAADVPAVIVDVEDESILVDLRWIQPIDDVALISTLVGHDASVTSDADVPNHQTEASS